MFVVYCLGGKKNISPMIQIAGRIRENISSMIQIAGRIRENISPMISNC